MTASSIPGGFLPNGSQIILNPTEEQIVKDNLATISKKALQRAFKEYEEDLKTSGRSKPFLFHICSNPVERGMNQIAVQLTNVAARTGWQYFQNLIQPFVK